MHDHNIMDDVHDLLPGANHIAINNVWLCLKVCYLSEIIDVSGILILPGYTTKLQTASRSTLKWPYQPPSPQNAWKHWTTAITLSTLVQILPFM